MWIRTRGLFRLEGQRDASRRWPNDFRAIEVQRHQKSDICAKSLLMKNWGERHDVEIYSDIKDVPNHPGCGIVKVEINLLEVVKEENFEVEFENDRPVQE